MEIKDFFFHMSNQFQNNLERYANNEPGFYKFFNRKEKKNMLLCSEDLQNKR